MMKRKQIYNSAKIGKISKQDSIKMDDQLFKNISQCQCQFQWQIQYQVQNYINCYNKNLQPIIYIL